jgi:hypothetical protein
MTKNKKRKIIMISTPIKPAGMRNVFKSLITIRPNRIVEKMRGRETMGVKAKAETNGIVRRYSVKKRAIQLSKLKMLCICDPRLLFCNISIKYNKSIP